MLVPNEEGSILENMAEGIRDEQGNSDQKSIRQLNEKCVQ